MADPFKDNQKVSITYIKSPIQGSYFLSKPLATGKTDLKQMINSLDEAVINALIHRDYSDPTSEVFIGIYPDRIEIINRGTLPLSDSQVKKKHESLSPNPDVTMAVFFTWDY